MEHSGKSKFSALLEIRATKTQIQSSVHTGDSNGFAKQSVDATKCGLDNHRTLRENTKESAVSCNENTKSIVILLEWSFLAVCNFFPHDSSPLFSSIYALLLNLTCFIAIWCGAKLVLQFSLFVRSTASFHILIVPLVFKCHIVIFSSVYLSENALVREFTF